MGAFVVKNRLPDSVTQVSNLFIDKYMPSANGSFVKVYLYLLRHSASNTSEELSLHTIADLFENTESDILRAFRYWEREGLLAMETSEDGSVRSLELLPLGENSQSEVSNETAATQERDVIRTANPAPKKMPTISSVPGMPEYDPLELSVLSEDTEIKEAATIVETMMGAPMTPPYQQLIVYFMSELGFSIELTAFAFETAFSKGKKAPRYIEKIGMNWAEKQIHTVEEADQESTSFHTLYNIIRTNLGMDGNLTPAQRAIIDKWDAYHFSDTVLAEACKRTILNTGKASLPYTDSILKHWHEAGITRLSDIEKLDKGHKVTAEKKVVKGKNRFQDFPQREYSNSEYESLEKQLLSK